MSDWLLWLRKTFLNVYYIYCFQRSYHFYCNCNWITSGGVWIFSCIHDIISFNSSPSRSWKSNRSRYCYWASASNKLVLKIITTRRLALVNNEMIWLPLGTLNFVETGVLMWPATLLGNNIGRRCCRCWFEDTLIKRKTSEWHSVISVSWLINDSIHISLNPFCINEVARNTRVCFRVQD